jgi:oxalate---CoA ligase
MNATLVPRAQLPLPQAYLAPRTPTEAQLAEIWRSVLSMDCVGVNDSYYDLGGDSLHAVVIFNMIERILRRTLPITVLADAQTVAGIARIIDHAPAAG